PALLLGLALVTGVLGLGIYSGVRTRNAADTTLRRTTADAAVPVVSVIAPTQSASTREILLPGTTQAFTDAPIFARTNGYVRGWYVDIGAHVKQGQLLAEIETPEVDQQLQQARADLETAQANLRQAQITADRWQALLESDSVSKQETDVAVSALSAMKATVNSNVANVRQLEQLQGFQKIFAPFDGVITARNVDIGVLINAGPNPHGAGQCAALPGGGASGRRGPRRPGPARSGQDRPRLWHHRRDRHRLAADRSGHRGSLGFAHQRHARADRPRAGRAEPMTRRAAGLAGLVAVLLGGCMVGPKYKKPSAPVTPAYKEMDGWKTAQPSDHLPRGQWWTVFGDSELNALEEQIAAANQNLRIAEARLRQARAL